jgi:hypothetical protein
MKIVVSAGIIIASVLAVFTFTNAKNPVLRCIKDDGSNLKNQKEVFYTDESVIIDGTLQDIAWQGSQKMRLIPSVNGVPEELSGTIRIIIRGDYLCIGTFCPEPGGKVLAKSFGFNPEWERDAGTSPPVEDILNLNLVYTTLGGEQTTFQLEMNPWGAYRIEKDGNLVPQSKTLVAARITYDGWYAEAAVPLRELNISSSDNKLKINIEQIRSRRALAPEYRWVSNGNNEFEVQATRSVSPPEFSPPFYGNNDLALKAGYLQKVPPLDAGWNEGIWKAVPVLELPRNEFNPHKPGYLTEVKWVHDGKNLALFFRCEEDQPIICNNGGHDSNVGNDDHVAVYLSTSGSAVLEILANAAGAIRDSKGTGPRMYQVNAGRWNGDIETNAMIEKEGWYLRMNIPVAEVAAGLDEVEIPDDWKILIARVRQPRAGEIREVSSLPIIGNSYFLAPARYGKFLLTRLAPDEIKMPEPAYKRVKLNGLAKELAEIDHNVLKKSWRKYHEIQKMLQDNMRNRITTLAMEEHEEWDKVQTLGEWERYRDKRIEILKTSLGEFPENSCPLNMEITHTYEGDGYQLKNLVFQSRPGLYVPGNLFLPENPTDNMPGIIIIPSHHAPKTQGELKDCGIIWARTGCAVLILETYNHGERVETLPWYRQAYESEYLMEMNLNLVGQSRLGWIVWDVKRAVDLFYEMGNINKDKIILMGSVTWGGGPPAALASIFEERLDAVIPFNYGRVYWQGWGLRKGLANKITPWFIYNAAAPMKFIYANEFGWEGDEGPSYPSVYTPAWPRFKKVYSLYNAEENLETTQGYGLMRAGPASHCGSIGTVQREPIFTVLKKWFDIPLPSEKEIKNPGEVVDRMPDEELICITPEVSTRLNRKPTHVIVKEIAENGLRSAREGRSSMDASTRRHDLIDGLSAVLIDIEPEESFESQHLWSKSLSEITLEGCLVKSEADILVPLLILKPKNSGNAPLPLVIALSEGGKKRFLKDRSEEIATLLKNNIAVCIPDVRGTGETAPDQYNSVQGFSGIRSAIANSELETGKTMLGLQFKDVRTVLNYLKSRNDFNAGKMAVWGESFAPVNENEIWVDELQGKPISPQIQHIASPLGAHLALLTALYQDEIKAVAVNGGLSGYLSVLDNTFSYIPQDIIVPEILKKGDINDICAGIAPKPLLMEGMVNGRNFLVDQNDLNRTMDIVKNAYRQSGNQENLEIRKERNAPELIKWLIEHLK